MPEKCQDTSSGCYDCPNESRPGVTTKVLSSKEAVERFKQIRGQISNLKVVGIIMKHIPIKGSALQDQPQMGSEEIYAIRKQCEKYVKQMFHCRQCRADAVDTLVTIFLQAMDYAKNK